MISTHIECVRLQNTDYKAYIVISTPFFGFTFTNIFIWTNKHLQLTMAIFKRKNPQCSPKNSEVDEDAIYQKGFTKGSTNSKVKADSLMCGEFCHYKGCEVQSTEEKKLFARKAAQPTRTLTPTVDSANRANPTINQLLKQSVSNVSIKPKKTPKYQEVPK